MPLRYYCEKCEKEVKPSYSGDTCCDGAKILTRYHFKEMKKVPNLIEKKSIKNDSILQQDVFEKLRVIIDERKGRDKIIKKAIEDKHQKIG